MNRNIKNLKFTSILIVLTFLCGSFMNAQELKFRQLESLQDWQQAKSDAKKSGKNIFLDIYATWCGPCKKLDAEVYTVPLVTEYFTDNFINLKIDGETDLGRILAAQYSLTGYPSMYFIAQDELLIHELVGYREAEILLNEARVVKDYGKRYTELYPVYLSKSLNPEQQDEFIDLLVKFGKKTELTAIATEKIMNYTEADILNPQNKNLVMAVVSTIQDFPANNVLKNAEALKTSWGNEDFIGYLSSVFDITIRTAVENGDSILMEKLAGELIPVYMMDNPDRINEAKLTTRKIYYSQTEEWDNYISEVEKYFNEFEPGNMRFLHQEAYYIIENQLNSQVLLTKSMEWVERIIAVQPDFENYFLAAVISTYRADDDAILKWMNLAGGKASSDDEKASLDELKKYLESQ